MDIHAQVYSWGSSCLPGLDGQAQVHQEQARPKRVSADSSQTHTGLLLFSRSSSLVCGCKGTRYLKTRCILWIGSMSELYIILNAYTRINQFISEASKWNLEGFQFNRWVSEWVHAACNDLWSPQKVGSTTNTSTSQQTCTIDDLIWKNMLYISWIRGFSLVPYLPVFAI